MIGTEMLIESWPIDRPIEYVRNARKITQAAVDKVAASIQEFGFNVFVSDTERDAIRQLSASRVWRSKLVQNLRRPLGLAVDAAGALLIADSGNGSVRRLTNDGAVATVAEGLGEPAGLAIDSTGSIFVADRARHVVWKIGPGQSPVIFAGNESPGFSGDGEVALLAQLSRPHGVAIALDGALLIADTDNHRIRRVGSDGIISTVAGNGDGGFSGHDVYARDASLLHPRSVATSQEGGFFITDTNNHRVRYVSPEGIIRTTAGTGEPGLAGDGGLATQSTLHQPAAAVIDGHGELYFTDIENQAIRRIASDGTITSLIFQGR